MIIYPAIDLRGGQCVRLYQGDYQQETIYASEPLVMADVFASDGASWLHVVDLDGAKHPEQAQKKLILALLQKRKLSIQIGGGIRSRETIETYLENGASRVVIGSLAACCPETVLTWFQYFGPERLVLALDVMYDKDNQPFVASNAWQTITKHTPASLISIYQAVGLKHVLCTDITRDGTLQGPNVGLYESLLRQFPELHIQASGGIQSLSDLVLLQDKGLRGAITGRALYEKKFTLREALSC